MAAIVISLLPFAALEAGLRVFSDPPAVQDGIDHDPLVDLDQLRPLFVLNEASDRWEIPPQRYNFFRPDSFAAKKAASVRRVFVLGGSTVQGRPYETETAFSTWLRLRLEAADTNHQYEVINCGGVSYASYRVAKILQEVIGHQADAIVLYTGHNEFLEDRTYAEVREMGTARRWANHVGSKLRTVQWMRSKGQGMRSKGQGMRSKGQASSADTKTQLPTEVNARLDRSGGLESYRRDPVWRCGVESHFADKLQQMVDVAQRAGVPLILCTPASDVVNTPPFKSETLGDLDQPSRETFTVSWNALNDADQTIERRMELAKKCLQIDPNHAGANYVLGRLLLQHGDLEDARRHLLAARDHDVCPLRAPTTILQTVRRVAATGGVPLVDTVLLLDQRSVQGKHVADQIPDPERFVDHLHPSVVGHQMIAEAVADQLHRLGWGKRDTRADQAYEAAAREHLSGLGEDYFARGKQRLEGLRRWATGNVK